MQACETLELCSQRVQQNCDEVIRALLHCAQSPPVSGSQTPCGTYFWQKYDSRPCGPIQGAGRPHFDPCSPLGSGTIPHAESLPGLYKLWQSEDSSIARQLTWNVLIRKIGVPSRCTSEIHNYLCVYKKLKLQLFILVQRSWMVAFRQV